MKTVKILLPSLLLFFFSCSKDGDAIAERNLSTTQEEQAKPGEQQGGISDIDIPETSPRTDPVKIKVTAIGYNSCWSNMRLELTKLSTFHYELRSYGTVSGSNCENTQVRVSRQTSFIPTSQGTYTVTVYKSATNTVDKKVVVLFTR
jgi:hypothetical protein